ncbi:KDP operon transcriptional regulatory protein KdpE [Marinomonas spartinae]|uniref:KDP operon transcriptional regulatory protein KdpE n=1 Tax=Marinomonas spartinae TaxID=1792290 RepID=A0A1A8TPG2_9GAMM|nr:response regulator [Marinomonas spartinae]SBS34620.1 KDP operon transcriptional regulatory protein KdpE [Marinomonas spartinae]
MGIKIVVIDDESQIRRMLRVALGSEGYEVIEAENGEAGLMTIVRHQPNLVILDLGLPDMDGHQVLREMRSWSSVPTIVLSVRNHDKEKVAALDSGAQDYITKPFSVIELLARIRVCLRDNIKPDQLAVIDDGKLYIDLSRREVRLNDAQIVLTPKEYGVLAILASSPNCVITQTQLLKEIWGPSHIDDTHYLRIVVSHLRQKLGDDPVNPKYLKTEAGVGYRFCLEE